MFGLFLRAMLLLVGTSFFFGAWGKEQSFTVAYAQTRLVDQVYHLDAQFSYELSPEARKALLSGVQLTLVLDIEVYRKRWYWWDAKIANITQRYLLKYHMLTKRFVLKWLNTGVQKNYSALRGALNELESIKNFPLLDSQLVDANEVYSVALQTYLDIEALPPPLRPVAYFSQEWHLSSERFLCLLTP